MKKVISIVAMMLLISASASAYSFKSGKLCYYIVSGTNTVLVTYEKWATPSYNNLSGDITIPPTVSNGGKTYTVVGLDRSAFKGCGITSCSIPSTVQSIGSDAFCQCGSLTSVNIPDGVTVIKEYCFSSCSSLKSIVIPNSVTKIEDIAFRNCKSLESVTMSDNVTSFGMDAFDNCNSLSTIRIPAGVTNIGQTAFSSSSLVMIKSEIQDPSQVQINSWAFMSVDKQTCRLVVPTGTVEAYKAAPVWKDFLNITEHENPDPTPDPTWTRYDINGVGYAFEYGGKGTSNLCDGDAATKFYGTSGNCWLVMQASKEVAVKQYSLVTADDSRENYDRALRNWKLQGSNDFENWTDIDVRKDYPMPFMNQTEVVIPVNDTKKYRYFKFICQAGSSNNVQLSEVWINNQNHDWRAGEIVEPTCGKEGIQTFKCPDCNAYKYEFIKPTDNHRYVNGTCSECGLEFSEVRLIYNAQDFTHYVKALHQYRNSDQSWPYLPMGWSNPSFDDKDWIDLPLPTASPGHSDGPFESLHYNSFWYDEYNGYLMRFPIYLSKIASGAEFFFSTVHDDNFALFVNGLMVESLEGWSSTPAGCTWATTATRYEIPSSSFKVGKNVVAVYMQQNYGGAYFDFELTATGVTVGARLQGDVNGDGEVNVQDVTALITYILGTTPPNFNVDNANVNGEGEIDVQDVTALINLILK